MDEKSKNRTKRSALADYYGVSDDNNSKKVSINPLDINSPHFDPNSYIKEILANNTLKQLTSKSTSMAAEIKTLNNDMQTLVYENYNKFITATDTVKQMKIHVTKM